MKHRTFFAIFFLTFVSALNGEWKKLLDKEGNFISFDNVIILAADSGVYRSLNYGKTWTFNIVDKYNDIYITASRFCQSDKYIFATTNRSVYWQNMDIIRTLSRWYATIYVIGFC